VNILIDECVPRQIRTLLPGHFVRTAREIGLAGYKNGKLIEAAEGKFDLLITSDKNLRYQQNLASRVLSILLLSTNKRSVIESNGDKILRMVNRMKPKSYEELEL
jgi:predicted nuclease of predicted toxin-antitoxin system